MYQYKAVLLRKKEVIAQGHSLEDVEKQIVRFKREQKYRLHTDMNNQIQIIHVKRDQVKGKGKEDVIKIV